MADIEDLIELHRKRCNRYVNGKCTTRACCVRGGYIEGKPVDWDRATCEEHETATTLSAQQREIAELRERTKSLELMVADHPMVPARDSELNGLLTRADRMARGMNKGPVPRAIDWERMELIERAIRRCLIDTEALGAHRLLTDTVVLLERAQQRVAAWIDLQKPGAALNTPSQEGEKI